MRLPDYGGDWPRYLGEIYRVFRRDFVDSQPQFRGRWVRCRRDTQHDQKEAGFWHCVQAGEKEAQRTPDLRRCERISWVRAIIENEQDASVEVWPTRRGSDRRMCLWYAREYLVVLGERKGYWQLITAYPTDREHTRRKLEGDMRRAASS